MEPSAEQRRQLEIEILTDGAGKLAGNVARELTSLLLLIRRDATALRTAMAGDDPRQDALEEIVDATQRATALAARLHAFSRSRVERVELPTRAPDEAAGA